MRRLLAIGAVITTALGVAYSTANAATFLRFNSQPGDPTGRGHQRIEFDENGLNRMTAVPNAAGGVTFFRGPPCFGQTCLPVVDYTSVALAPAAGTAFGTGVYRSAQRITGTGGNTPGLLADWNLRNWESCPTLTGQFVVLELERAPDGSILRFAADFEQHCLGQAPGLFGGVRFNSDVPYTPGVGFAPASIEFSSEPGDPLGLGEMGSFGSIDGTAAALSYAPNGVTIWLPSPMWTYIMFAGPQLAKGGTYVVDPTQVTSASLWVGFGSHACQLSVAKFTVVDLEWSELDQLVRFVADLEGQCFDAPGKFRATVRYNTPAVPIPAPEPSPPVTTRTARGTSPAGGAMALSIESPRATCTLSATSFLDPRFAESSTPLPTFVAYPHGLLDFTTNACGEGQPITVTVRAPQALPPTAQAWTYGRTPNHPSPHWYVVPAVVDGDRITFTVIDGGVGDDDLFRNGSTRYLGLIGFAGGVYQDLWWSGPAENGWGMSVVQHRDTLFANIYTYDAQGEPTWYVMPSGEWNEARTTFTGPIYLPKGSAYFAYDARRFDVGAAIGTASLTFYAMNDAALEYTIDGVKGRKTISRVGFGSPAEEASRNVSDLWWGGEGQNGWGVALMQQHSALFALWFTYDAAGKPRWFVMPGGDWNGADIYQGALFRATGSPWLGKAYDPAKHRMNEAGSYRFRFSGDAATFDYSVDGRVGSLPLSRIPF